MLFTLAREYGEERRGGGKDETDGYDSDVNLAAGPRELKVVIAFLQLTNDNSSRPLVQEASRFVCVFVPVCVWWITSSRREGSDARVVFLEARPIRQGHHRDAVARL